MASGRVISSWIKTNEMVCVKRAEGRGENVNLSIVPFPSSRHSQNQRRTGREVSRPVRQEGHGMAGGENRIMRAPEEGAIKTDLEIGMLQRFSNFNA